MAFWPDVSRCHLRRDRSHVDPVAAPSAVEAPPVAEPTAPEAPAPALADADFANVLSRIDWASVLARRPGWSWDAATGDVVCGNDGRLVLTTVRKAHSPGETGLVFCRPVGGCDTCPTERRCLHSQRPRAAKHLEVSVPAEIAIRLREHLRSRRGKPRQVPKRTAPPYPPRSELPPGLAVNAIPSTAGQHAVAPSLFLPAKARQILDASTSHLTVVIRTPRLRDVSPEPMLVARSEGARQHRRLTWRQHLDRNALPQGQPASTLAAGR